MNPALLETLKARYNFRNWAKSRTDEQLYVRNYRVTGEELPNSLLKSRTARLTEARRLNTSVWATIGAAAEREVLVDVFEYETTERALEVLLEFTSQFHQPTSLSVRQDDVGDVCIATSDGAWFSFARGNLVVRVVSGDGVTNPAREVAQQIDADLISKPETEMESTTDASTLLAEVPEETRMAAEAARPFREPAEDDPEDEPMIKVFSKGGRVTVVNDSVVVPESPAVEVEVFVSPPGKRQWSGRRYEHSLEPNDQT